MNVADSEAMLSLLCDDYRLVEHAEDSDLIILNTCHIREKAYHKVVSKLGKLQQLKRQRPGLRIVLAGCVAQAEGKRMLKTLPMIDVLVGPGRLQELPRLLRLREHEESSQWALGFHQHTSARAQKVTGSDASAIEDVDTAVPAPAVLFPKDAKALAVSHPGKNTVSRYITIQQGCDNYCTFCVVPHTRGGEVSLPIPAVVDRTRSMLATGAREICLLGQNVNSYGSDLVRAQLMPGSVEGPFYDLLRALLALEGDWRLRFTTSNPHDLTYGVAKLFQSYDRLGKYFHLPVQSGSDRILQAMKRKVTREEYLRKIGWLRESAPSIALSTDIIVGFPGETEDDFEATCDLVRQVRYSFIYAFCYSPRKNTPAQRFSHQVPQETKSRRLNQLLNMQKDITQELQDAELGTCHKVLFLYASSKEEHCYYGRTPHYRLVKVCSPKRDLVGREVLVKITNTHITTLEGVAV